MRHPAERVVTYTRHYAFLAGLFIYRGMVKWWYWKSSQMHFILYSK